MAIDGHCQPWKSTEWWSLSSRQNHENCQEDSSLRVTNPNVCPRKHVQAAEVQNQFICSWAGTYPRTGRSSCRVGLVVEKSPDTRCSMTLTIKTIKNKPSRPNSRSQLQRPKLIVFMFQCTIGDLNWLYFPRDLTRPARRGNPGCYLAGNRFHTSYAVY